MTTAGLYETSGDWLYDVGLPGKSGIGGGIVTVSPGKGGLGTFAPLLDDAGNSVKGQLAARFLSEQLGPRPVRLGARGVSVRVSLACVASSRLALVVPAARVRRADGRAGAGRALRARRRARRAGARMRHRASRTSRSTSTRSSTSRPSRCEGPGARRPREDRAVRERSHRRPLRVPPRLPRQSASTRAATTSAGGDRSPTERRRPSTRTSRPTPRDPGKLALQYWFFYVFNDWNNTHEGDWEMIQLNFDAAYRARGAVSRSRRRVGYSQHEGAERADVGRPEAHARRRHPSGRPSGGRLARELLRRGPLPRQLGLRGRRLRRHERADVRRPARS